MPLHLGVGASSFSAFAAAAVAVGCFAAKFTISRYATECDVNLHVRGKIAFRGDFDRDGLAAVKEVLR